jgi:hypothetical protein
VVEDAIAHLVVDPVRVDRELLGEGEHGPPAIIERRVAHVRDRAGDGHADAPPDECLARIEQVVVDRSGAECRAQVVEWLREVGAPSKFLLEGNRVVGCHALRVP